MLQPTYINIYRNPINTGNNSLIATINASALESIEWGRQNTDTNPENDTFYITGCYTLSNSDHDWVIAIGSLANPNSFMGQAYPSNSDKVAIMNHIVDQLVRVTQKAELATESNVQNYYPPANCDLGSGGIVINPFEVIKSEEPPFGEEFPPGFGEPEGGPPGMS